jgi:hypothetical protein
MSQRYAAGAQGAQVKLRLGSLALVFLFLAGCRPAQAAQVPIPAELSLEEHELARSPEAEYAELVFVDATQAEILAKHADERARINDSSSQPCSTIEKLDAECTRSGQDEMSAWTEYGLNLIGTGKVILTSNGRQIYSINVGDSSPIGALRGLWAYEGHWVLETAYVKNHQHGNEIDSQATGQISLDGKLINRQMNYQEAFGFQILHGKPFYFFQKDGKIGISYDNVEIPLGYDEIPHYGCCSAATLNPDVYENMVAFFARKGSTWYYIEAGVFD